jgi:hypothetical protein
MDSTKPWYLSRTIWASLITVAISIAGVLGVPVAGIDDAGLTDAVLQGATAIAGIVAVFGRLSAKDRIG